MDIQRDDQVRYQGQVWEVFLIEETAVYFRLVTIKRWMEDGSVAYAKVFEQGLQRVEQVR